MAKLAGLPGPVVKRAREVLARLEKSDRRRGDSDSLEDLPLFAHDPQAAGSPGRDAPSALELALDKLNPDELSPRAALDALYELKALRRSESQQH